MDGIFGSLVRWRKTQLADDRWRGSALQVAYDRVVLRHMGLCKGFEMQIRNEVVEEVFKAARGLGMRIRMRVRNAVCGDAAMR